jgi:transformation/transcription domain-associated protein
VDSGVSYHLWVLVFPIVWATLQKQQQINLAKPIISMLSKEFHQRQAMMRPNVVQVSHSDLARLWGLCLHRFFPRC